MKKLLYTVMLILTIPAITFADTCEISLITKGSFFSFANFEKQNLPPYTEFNECLETAIKLFNSKDPVLKKQGVSLNVSMVYKTEDSQNNININSEEFKNLRNKMDFYVNSEDLSNGYICKAVFLKERSMAGAALSGMMGARSFKHVDLGQKTITGPKSCNDVTFKTMIKHFGRGDKTSNARILFYDSKSKMVLTSDFYTTLVEGVMLREHLEDKYSLVR